jgi:hypothetical protein
MFVVVVPATVSMPVQVQPCHDACVHQPGGLPVIMPPLPPVGPEPLVPPAPPEAPPVPPFGMPPLPPFGIPPLPPFGMPPLPPVPTLHVPAGTQPALQSSMPAGQEHALFAHCCPPEHAMPQLPQLNGSLTVFTQDVPHTMPGHCDAHVLLTQNCAVAGQTLPHVPQFSESAEVLMQPVPHACQPGGHAQAPFTHACPPEHTRPQPPQFAVSFRMLAH